MASAEFPKFAGILSEALQQHHLLGLEIAQLEFHHLHYLFLDLCHVFLDLCQIFNVFELLSV